MIGEVSKYYNSQFTSLERVTDFGLDATVETFHAREGAEEEAAGEGECFHTEAASDGGIQTDAVLVFLTVFVIKIVAVFVINRLRRFFRPEMESDACSNVDERFQFATSVKIVAVVEKNRDFLECGGIQAVTDTDANGIVLFDGNAVDENTRPANALSNEKSVFIDEIVGNLFLLLFLCVQRAQPATQDNTQQG